ncbi:MAG: Stp1/IreP family PP2C-type Ser/Thr phosphatase [Elusimicrobia bacterium]|nr:Stp1/IreP family PP2C-type Ser/Thr phosphatase [Elusimicrobiota bacterium]MBD3412019.1 Stp1/IreP family PP2C-type Ser/Thr phosphatase [Elusimicrobiota bacterium]
MNNTNSNPEIRYAFCTSQGMVRKNNEDAYGSDTDMRFFFVCDGMGGHAAGDFASKTAVSTIQDIIVNEDRELFEFITFLENSHPGYPRHLYKSLAAIFLANQRLFHLAVQYPVLRGMGTTIVSLLAEAQKAYFLHAGDSRAYVLRNNALHQITADHSWLNELLEDKEITAEEAKNFKKKNIVTRVLGTQPKAKIDLTVLPVNHNDLILLCSDGLTGPVPHETIETILLQNRTDLDRSCTALIDAANRAGGPDNITAMLVEINSPGRQTKNPVPKQCEKITFQDADETTRKTEEKLIKKIFANNNLPIPVEATQPSQTSKISLPIIIVVGLLLGILSFLIYSIYTKIDQKMHPENYTLVEAQTGDTASLVGHLEIVTDPAGAEVYLNGSTTPSGITPVTLPFKNLDPQGNNIHYIYITKYGYQPVEIKKEIIINDTITLTKTLIPESKIELFLGIDADFPETADVIIASARTPDQTRVLTTIQRMRNLAHREGIPSGTYDLYIKDNDRTVWKYHFSIKPGKRAKIYLTKDREHEIIHYEDF